MVRAERLAGVISAKCEMLAHMAFTIDKRFYASIVEIVMAFSVPDVVSLSQALANLSGLAEESYIALIDVGRLDYCDRLERTRIHLPQLGDAVAGIAGIETERIAGERRTLAAQRASRAARP